MKHLWLKNGHRRLFVLALGWGQDPDSWSKADFGNRDVLLLGHWNAEGGLPDLSGYDEYDLVAWSFGVWSAAQIDWPVAFSSALAVNGTLFPADDDRGIPVEIFRKTIDGWVPGLSARKFWIRMGDRTGPRREDGDLLDELRYFRKAFEASKTTPTVRYTKAVVGTRDRIFPPANQKRAWGGTPVVEAMLPHAIGGHLVDILAEIPT